MDIPNHFIQAIKASIEASKVIMEVYKGEFQPIYKTDGSPVTVADFSSSSILMEYLAQTDIPIISEEVEKEDFSIRKNWKRVWIVDPLDGTKEFIRRNGEFVICIALIEDSKPIFGIITHPESQTILLGGNYYGAYHINFDQFDKPNTWRKLKPQPLNNPLILSSSRTPYKEAEKQLIDFLESKYDNVSYSKKGSALKFFDLALGKSDIYPRFAPTMEWDIAAGHAIINTLGGVVLEAGTNQPLTYNKPSLFNPYFIVYTKALKEKMQL